MQISLDACGVPLLSRQITSGISSKVAAIGALVNSCENVTGCQAVRNAVISKVLHVEETERSVISALLSGAITMLVRRNGARI